MGKMDVHVTPWRTNREGRSHLGESREEEETVLCKG